MEQAHVWQSETNEGGLGNGASSRFPTAPRHPHELMTRPSHWQSPWQELDKEDLAFKRYGPTGCLGSTPELGDFYGGKVSFCMRAQLEQGELRVTLERPVLGHSSRFTRCYGSSWLVKLRLPTDTLSKPDVLGKLRSFLTRPLVLNGRVFRFFNINKNHGAYFMATNEWYKGSLQRPSPLDDQGIYCSFLDFFRRHNDLEQNNKQVGFTLFNKNGSVLIT